QVIIRVELKSRLRCDPKLWFYYLVLQKIVRAEETCSRCRLQLHARSLNKRRGSKKQFSYPLALLKGTTRVNTALLLLCFPFLFSGCITATVIAPQVTSVDIPAVNIVAVAELGDTIVDRGVLKAYPGINFSQDVTREYWNGTAKLPAGTLKAALEDAAWTYYEAHEGIQSGSLAGPTKVWRGGVAVAKKDTQDVRFWVIQPSPGRRFCRLPT